MTVRSSSRIVDIVEIRNENDIIFLSDEHKDVLKNKNITNYPFVAVFILMTKIFKRITGEESIDTILTVNIYQDISDYQERKDMILRMEFDDTNNGKNYDTSISGYAKRRLIKGNK